MTIRERELGKLGALLGEGGFGEVFAVPRFTLPGFPGRLAYKRPKAGSDRAQTLVAMASAVKFRDFLSRTDRDVLDKYTAWPLEMVEDDLGHDCGMLMPLISKEFMITVNPGTAGAVDKLFEISWLSAKDAQIRSTNIDRSVIRDLTIRLKLLAQVVYIVGWLHKHDRVYGDLSLKNVIISLSPDPRIKLIDCDGTASLSDPARKQGNTLSFDPPEWVSGQVQDTHTDVYKLGLCVIRGLQWGPGLTQARIPNTPALTAQLDPSGITMLRRIVDKNAVGRPTAKELYQYLLHRLSSLTAVPEIIDLSLDRRALPRGMEVRVRWTIGHADRIVITGANRLHIDVDPSLFPTGIAVKPLATGDLDVEVINQNGSVAETAGHVDLYELPLYNVSIPRVPALAVPPLPEVDLPRVLSSLPAVPAVSVLQNPVPRIQSPSLETVFETLRPVTGTTSPFMRVDEVVADGLVQVQANVSESIRKGFGIIDLEKIAEAARKAAVQATGIPGSPVKTGANP